MNIRQVLAIAGIPLTIGTFFVAPSQAKAAHLSNLVQISQNSPDDGPRRPEEEPRRPDDKPPNKHQRPRLHQKKRPPQPPIDRPDQPPRDRPE
ncbi:MAG: hypothetical protein PUP91_05890 [Rhizonema sp. PD37]|nr:hypothetical protein [Rhizonema sp. PD37]